MTSQNATGWLACMIEFVSHNLGLESSKLNQIRGLARDSLDAFFLAFPCQRENSIVVVIILFLPLLLGRLDVTLRPWLA